ncbi:MAG: hypothetical protein ISR69_06175, partial [Gammaproteobacteria bacterium]|nr:hypothetical protein [Gammaproteobacteria bacterium]
MATSTQHIVQGKRFAFLISIVILLLAGLNGIFTFSGAKLFIDEVIYALFFALAVQFSIAISLLALPYVKGIGKLVLIIVYFAALTLSTLSAYTFIYNAGLPGAMNNTSSLNTQLKAKVSDRLSQVVLLEQKAIDVSEQKIGFLTRQAEEEALRGFRSGLGAGKGPEYYKKMEEVAVLKIQFASDKRDFKQAQQFYDQLIVALTKNSPQQRDEVILLLARLKAVTNTEQAESILTDITQQHVAVLQSPVETAMGVILDRDNYSVQLVVSVIWAAVFDLLALFLGIIRYYILKPDYSILSAAYEGIANLVTFFIRLGYIKKDAHQKYRHNLETKSHDTPLNSSEMQSFATYIMAGSLFSAKDNDDAMAPLQKMIGHIEPLKISDNPSSVGVPFKVVDEHADLKTLMAMLIQNSVFLTSTEDDSYVLNPGSEMAQKILIFIKMGLKDPKKQKEMS